MSYIGNINELVMRNDNFREVVFTGVLTQICVMCIPTGSAIGEYVLSDVEQTFFVTSGVCDVTLDHKRTQVTGGDVVVVSPGTQYNFINTGEESVRVVVYCTPPVHRDGNIHETIIDAISDEENNSYNIQTSQQ